MAQSGSGGFFFVKRFDQQLVKTVTGILSMVIKAFHTPEKQSHFPLS
jgi:hypothetical protein